MKQTSQTNTESAMITSVHDQYESLLTPYAYEQMRIGIE